MKKTFIFIITLMNFFISSAQKRPLIKKIYGSGISEKKLTAGLRHIVNTARIMGLSVAIINDGKIVYKKTFGFSNKEKNTTLNDSTAMYAASFTKPVSAVLFLKLVDKGIFNLDSPLIKYLKNEIGSYEKWMDLARDKPFEKVTARMILSHSSGLPILRQIYKDKTNLIATPGTTFYYSNEGMNLLGFVIEEYTGQKLQDLAREYIFQPLFMNNTGMIWQRDFEKNYALGYSRAGAVIGMSKRTNARAAGSMTTIAADYAKFVISMMEQKGLSINLSEQLFSPQIKIKSNRGFGPQRDSLTNKYNKLALSWGLGVGLFKTSFGNAFFHGGHSEGWQNYFVAYPDKKIAVVLMSNSSNFEHAAGKILKLCIGDTLSPLEWLGYNDNNE